VTATTSTRAPLVALLFLPYVAVALVHLVALGMGAPEVAGFTKPLLMPVLLAGV